ncbi:MAG TPA: RagB/SusD family nutrient uptake outer membrane protein [Mucilaginibacter sp.]|nr:RagB/SusD family nutrient uptake outer membrane protein [Mucilaginibacter sp.]
MKKNILILSIATFTLVYSSCKIDRTPESVFSDANFWNNESDLQNAANRFYQQLPGYTVDSRSDEYVSTSPDNISNSTRGIVATSNDWNLPYQQIFVANNILEKGVKASVADAIKNRYFGEARFFRAYYYFMLVEKYGDVPLVLKTLSPTDPNLTMPRSPRETVIKAIYDDLDFAAEWLPTRAQLPNAQYGRVTKSAALALKARVGLYEGTWLKFRSMDGWQDHLQKAVDAATAVMGQGHTLYNNYPGMFLHEGEGPSNTENIFVKIYGVNNANVIVSHNTSRDLENGRIAPTRNLLRMFDYSDGLPAYNTDGTPSDTKSSYYVPESDEESYNTIMDNRDPRLATAVWRAGEVNWKGPWVPITSLGVRTGLAGKKGWNQEDWAISGSATVDKPLIRYAEVLLILAEAKYELNGSISDADLDATINALRRRAGATVMLTNAFVTAHNLSMREEIRRERTEELCLEGFRYDDLIRWKTAEVVLPETIYGAKYTTSEWVGTKASSLNLDSDNIIIVEDASKRSSFNPGRDYLYPIPLNEISLSGGNVKQNPGW